MIFLKAKLKGQKVISGKVIAQGFIGLLIKFLNKNMIIFQIFAGILLMMIIGGLIPDQEWLIALGIGCFIILGVVGLIMFIVSGFAV
ncbi:MAG: hypothetical protein ACJAW3_001320 [Lentimonas sp.]